MARLGASLRKDGHAVYSAGYPSTQLPYPDLLRHVATSLQSAGFDGSDGPVAFVCHSLGGLIWRDLARELPTIKGGPAALLGTPLHGSILARTLGDGRMVRLALGPAMAELGLERDDCTTTYPGPFITIAGTKCSPLLPWSHVLKRVAGMEPSDSTVLVREVRSVKAADHIEVKEIHTLLPSNARAIAVAQSFIQTCVARHRSSTQPVSVKRGPPVTTRKLPKTPTLRGKVFWADVAKRDGWRIQYNKTLDTVSPLKPYRLLDPDDYLCASSNSVEEMVADLPGLIEEYGAKKPVFTREEVIEMAKNLASVLIQAAAAKGGRAGSRPSRGR